MIPIKSRWVVLGILFICRIALGFQFQTLGSVSNRVAPELQLNYQEVGVLIGLFLLPGAFLAIPFGYASKVLSDRLLVGFGLLALGLGGTLAAMANGYGMLALGRIVCGVGFVVSTIYFAKMVADWFSGKELATAMGVLVMSWPFGIAIGQISHEWVAELFNWRVPFYVASTYCLIGAVVLIASYRSPIDQKSQELVTRHLTRRELILTAIAALVWGVFNAAYVVYLSFAPRLLIDAGVDSTQAAVTISLASWVMIVSGAMAGYLADKTGRRDLVLYICLLAAMVSLLLLPFTFYAVALSLLFGLLGMAPAGIIMALTGESMSPNSRAVGMGVFFTIFFVVVSPAPAIAGWLFDITNDAYAPIVFAVALFGLTGVLNQIFRVIGKNYSKIE